VTVSEYLTASLESFSESAFLVQFYATLWSTILCIECLLFASFSSSLSQWSCKIIASRVPISCPISRCIIQSVTNR